MSERGAVPATRREAAPYSDGGDAMRGVALTRQLLRYRLVRTRRRSIAIIVRDGTLEARAPLRASIALVESFIRSKERWIARQLAESPSEAAPLRWRDGEQILLLGRTARLRASSGASAVQWRDGCLSLPESAPLGWRALAIDWLRATALELFRTRVRHYAARLGVEDPSLGLSDARTQWGSCRPTQDGRGRVLISWRLIHLPPHLIDYVVAHELAHLREPNHSPRFWAVVSQLFPDYLRARKQLNQLGRTLPRL